MGFQFYQSRIFIGIWHIIAISQFAYALHFDWNLNIPDTPGVPKMVRSGFGGKSRFLTYWSLVGFQHCFFYLLFMCSGDWPRKTFPWKNNQ